MISQLLTIAFHDLAGEIVIRGNDGSWDYAGSGSKLRKQKHIASAAEEMMRRKVVEITRFNTILIDDDEKNITEALKCTTNAVPFHPESPDTFPDELLDTLRRGFPRS